MDFCSEHLLDPREGKESTDQLAFTCKLQASRPVIVLFTEIIIQKA